MYDENKQLYDENKALRDQNDRLKQQQAMAGPRRPQLPVSPTTSAVAPTPPPPVAEAGSVQHRRSSRRSRKPEDQRRTGNTDVYLPSKLLLCFRPGDAPAGRQGIAGPGRLRAEETVCRRDFVEGHTDKTPIKVSKWASNEEFRSPARRGQGISHRPRRRSGPNLRQRVRLD